MSGHSKWHNIQAKKGKADAARGKIFTKLGRELLIAVKEGGPDPAGNSKLKNVIAKCKAANMPNDTIERAIKKAASTDMSNFESVTYEGYGPNGSTIIVKCLTDNINRTISQVRPAFTKSKAKLGNEGSVAYLYDTYAILTFKGLDEEATLEALMEGDADCQEIETLENYVLDQTKHEITLKYKDQYTPVITYETILENHVPTGKLEFTKTDFSESKTLPNTTIEIYSEDDILIYSGKTDENGKIIIDRLPVGKYYILEKLL